MQLLLSVSFLMLRVRSRRHQSLLLSHQLGWLLHWHRRDDQNRLYQMLTRNLPCRNEDPVVIRRFLSSKFFRDFSCQSKGNTKLNCHFMVSLLWHLTCASHLSTLVSRGRQSWDMKWATDFSKLVSHETAEWLQVGCRNFHSTSSCWCYYWLLPDVSRCVKLVCNSSDGFFLLIYIHYIYMLIYHTINEYNLHMYYR